MIILLVSILFIVYIISIFGAIEIFVNKNIDMSFLSLMIVMLPIINTYICIRYSLKGELKDILKKLKNN